MLDTVILSIPKGKFKTLLSSSRFYPEWTFHKSGKHHKIWIKNWPKQKTPSDPYYPRLTGYKRPDEAVEMINVEFSAAKLIYGNNLNEIEEKDFSLIIDTLQEKLKNMGEIISKADLINANVSGFDPAKNVALTDGYTAFAIIRELGKINIHKKLDLTKVTFKNDGYGLQIYAKSYSLVFYDKIADLNQKVRRAVDKDQTPLQLSLFKEIKEKNPFLEVIRFEVRLRDRKKRNSVLNSLGFPSNPTFKDVCRKDICQKIVKWYWDTIITGENLFLFELENNPKRLLRKILKKDTVVKAKQAVFLVGLNVLCKDDGGIRELRHMLEKRITQRNWYPISDSIKSLNEFISKTELHSWVGQIGTCLEKFEAYKAPSQ